MPLLIQANVYINYQYKNGSVFKKILQSKSCIVWFSKRNMNWGKNDGLGQKIFLKKETVNKMTH